MQLIIIFPVKMWRQISRIRLSTYTCWFVNSDSASSSRSLAGNPAPPLPADHLQISPAHSDASMDPPPARGMTGTRKSIGCNTKYGGCIYIYIIYMCVYVCMHVCMYACMHVCMYACMHVCMYACMYACMHVCMHACMHVCVYACICVCICVCVCKSVCVCVYVCLYVCMYFCLYICKCINIYLCMYVCTYVRM